MNPYAHITGWGMAVPENVMTNDDISKLVDTNDAWIRERTGIHERRIASPGETTASLAAEASLKALRLANLPPADLDLVIVSTCSPEHLFPATASIVQDKIGATHAGAFDILAACTGFIFALNMATQSIRSGSIKNALVIGSETLSRLLDWTDRGTCILFGDGAGAFVIQASDTPGGVLSSVMRSDGSGSDLLCIPAGGSAIPVSQATIDAGLQYVKMNGSEVFRFATRVMAKASEEALEKANMTIDEIDLIIPHQANMRIIKAAARGLKQPMDKFMVNLQKYGNTSTASIPIAAVEAFEEGRLRRNDKIVMVGFGGGLTWGALTALWTGPFSTQKPLRLKGQRRKAKVRSWYRRAIRKLEGFIWGRKNRLR